MILIDKCLNHLTWLISANKEHNKQIVQDLSFKMSDKVFILNKSFQKYYYSFSLYQKLFNRFDKSFNYVLSNNKLNRHLLSKIKNTYLNRSAFYFKEAGLFLKAAKGELNISSQNFAFLYQEMKNISSIMMSIENDINFLIKNLY